MNDIKITQNQLPNLSSDIKSVINKGIWSLYIVDTDEANNIFMLVTEDRMYYFLDATGSIIEVFDKRPANIKYEYQVYFSNIPMLAIGLKL
jgi:hypothetical protein